MDRKFENKKMNEYLQVAYYYDELVANMDYNQWLHFIQPYLTKDTSILDLACGSGTLAILLALQGYQVEGLDLSSDILEIAREKAKINHVNIPFYKADMANFELSKKYDIITCFFDSINFLDSKEKIDHLFSCVLKHLKPNGYFIFDLFSKTMMKEYRFNEMIEKTPTYEIVWRTNKVNSTTLKHSISIQEGDLSFEEEYYEYYYKLKSLNLKKFKLLKIVGDFNGKLSSKDERILVVLQAL